jgi:hypothetical protein
MMLRREFLTGLTATIIAARCSAKAMVRLVEPYAIVPGDYSDYVTDYLDKMRHYDEPNPEDIFVERDDRRVFESCTKRLRLLEQTAGGGNFQLLALDDALSIARDYPRVGEFSSAELDFLEKIFYFDATRYGFHDNKHLQRITDRIPAQEAVKVPYTGTYLYRGLPLDTYQRIKRDVGDSIILTSGVRGVMKQFHLFLRKAYDFNGNLSLASRSLAPPGYSFHGISDFDVGQVGLGGGNFTSRFATTEAYRRLQELDYLNLRYPLDNLLGVRFEPWHVKVEASILRGAEFG